MAGTNTPNLNLYKPNRTDNVSVIADLNDNMDKIDTFAGNVATAESNSKGTVAIVEDGNTCTHVGGIASGQYVVWKGLLYKATQAISVGTTLSTSTNLSAVTDGIANELNSKIATIGTVVQGTVKSSLAVPNETFTDIATMSLTKGVWAITGGTQYTSSFTQQAITRLCQNGSGISGTSLRNTGLSGGGSCVSAIISINTTVTVSLNVYQGSESSVTAVGVALTAVRIA